MKTVGVIEEYGTYIFIGVFTIFLFIKTMTWETSYKAKPHTQCGKKIVYIGSINQRFSDTITYNKRQWFIYCPLIHKKPKKWGVYKR